MGVCVGALRRREVAWPLGLASRVRLTRAAAPSILFLVLLKQASHLVVIKIKSHASLFAILALIRATNESLPINIRLLHIHRILASYRLANSGPIYLLGLPLATPSASTGGVLPLIHGFD